ncbi:REP-associated tyrosine transposase [Desulfurispira natronophila]|uniref:Putative transposase n=1 Tax=Desulfurispira natronophila TaxID=682562 RepID=A0A7W7Y6B6_9BACT|nr:transposase [Desulfurispira natronophila]MBB5022542.1 putative transposase [Desulfurispira natronophila]
MSEYRRIYQRGGSYFFTLVTHQRKPLFSDANHVDILRRAMRQVMSTRPFTIHAIVVLPDHLHCIMQLPDGDADYSSRWREIKKAVSRQIAPLSNERNERMVWQRRFWEHAIRDENDWQRHADYIHYNPVKHGLVTRPALWPWTSFHKAVERGIYDPEWGLQEPPAISHMDCE